MVNESGNHHVPAAAAAALDYARRGWSVIPLRPGGKRPLIAWEAYQHRRAGPDQVAAWFRRWPDANVGIVTGAVSGLVVLDIDPRHGGADSLERQQRRTGPTPPTAEVRTGGDGRHLYFAHPGGVVRNRVAVLPGVDLRGDGGQVVAPPSRHPSGRHYAWVEGRGPDAVPLAPLPDWLLRPPGGAAQRGHPLAWWRALLRRGVAEGERNSSIAQLAGHLLWHGVDLEVATELLLCWNAARCRPPLPDVEVVRTVQSIARLHERAEDERP